MDGALWTFWHLKKFFVAQEEGPFFIKKLIN
jgi:hypothetical protein